MSKIIIGLDLSTTCTGYSIFDEKLIDYGRVKPKSTLDVLERIEYIARELAIIFEPYKGNDVKFIIEDIYLAYHAGGEQVTGFANLGRISGAIMEVIFELGWHRQDIELIKAISARPKVGIKGNCQKSEVQAWAIKTILNKDAQEYEDLIDAVYAEKFSEEISQATFKKRMDDISKIIEDETGISEDIADALLLGWGELNELSKV